jgi:hypothetical protein
MSQPKEVVTMQESASKKVYAQGDVLLLPVDSVPAHRAAARDMNQTVILAEGEHTGHRHAFYGGALMFRDDALARDLPAELYIGHVEVAAGGAVLEHGTGPGQPGDHDPIDIPAGTYVALRQREYVSPASPARTVAD